MVILSYIQINKIEGKNFHFSKAKQGRVRNKQTKLSKTEKNNHPQRQTSAPSDRIKNGRICPVLVKFPALLKPQTFWSNFPTVSRETFPNFGRIPQLTNPQCSSQN